MAPLSALAPAGSRRALVVDHFKSKYFIGSVLCLIAAMVAMLAAKVDLQVGPCQGVAQTQEGAPGAAPRAQRAQTACPSCLCRRRLLAGAGAVTGGGAFGPGNWRPGRLQQPVPRAPSELGAQLRSCPQPPAPAGAPPAFLQQRNEQRPTPAAMPTHPHAHLRRAAPQRISLRRPCLCGSAVLLNRTTRAQRARPQPPQLPRTLLPTPSHAQWFWMLLFAASTVPFAPWTADPVKYFRGFISDSQKGGSSWWARQMGAAARGCEAGAGWGCQACRAQRAGARQPAGGWQGAGGGRGPQPLATRAAPERIAQGAHRIT